MRRITQVPAERDLKKNVVVDWEHATKTSHTGPNMDPKPNFGNHVIGNETPILI